MPRLLPALLFALSAIIAAPAAIHAADSAGRAVDARLEVQAVITRQIDAFRHDDHNRAFSYAAPNIKKQFGTPERFTHMVRHGYAPVYRPARVAFDKFKRDGDKAVQTVLIENLEGNLFFAFFLMARQPDMIWKIGGCALVPLEDGAI